MKKLTYYQDKMRDAIEKDKSRDDYINRFKEFINLDWELPQALKDLPWMRTFVSSAPADAIDASCRALSTLMPNLTIYPQTTADGEKQRVKALEDALMWHFRKANSRGFRRPLSQIVESILKYGCVGMQVRYLPHEFRGSEARKNALKRQGDFAYVVYDPATVHAFESPYGLESVSVAKIMTLAQLEQELPDNAGVKSLVSQLKKQDRETREQTKVAYYDYVDYDDRVQWAVISDSIDKHGGGSSCTELLREPHKLPFLPMIYREARTPLLKIVADSNSWENQNVITSLRYALLVATVAQARSLAITMDGEGVEVDYTDPAQQVTLRPGEDFRNLPPAQTDENLNRQVAAGEAALTMQTRTRALQAAEDIASSAPFATFNAIMKTAEASLSDQINCANAALEDVFCHQLHWIKYSQQPLTAIRGKNARGYENDISLRMGATISIGDGSIEGGVDYSPADLDISVKIRVDTPTDRQARLNEATILHDRMGMSFEEALESSGLEDITRDEQAWLDEQISMATVQNEIARMQGAVQLELAQAQMGMQMQAQQQQMQQQQQMDTQAQAQQMSQGAAFDNAQGSPNAGGLPAQMQAPQMTREAITGQTQTGEQAMR